jgi:hypothetical protein
MIILAPSGKKRVEKTPILTFICEATNGTRRTHDKKPDQQ